MGEREVGYLQPDEDQHEEHRRGIGELDEGDPALIAAQFAKRACDAG